MAVKPKAKRPLQKETAGPTNTYAAAADVELGPDIVTIDLTDDPAIFTTSSFTVTGTARPNNATVFGTLINRAVVIPGPVPNPIPGTIPANPPSVVCTPSASDPTLGIWSLQFQNVPPGNYVLGVNEQLPSEGADAANIDVTAPVVVTLSVTTTPTTITATVTNTSTTEQSVSTVIVASKPEHGDHKHQRIPGGASRPFRFAHRPTSGLLVVAFPVGQRAKGAVVVLP